MARTVDVEWQEDADTLRRLYQQEHDGPVRTRLHALWLLRQGYAQQALAPLLGVSVRALQNWVRWYRTGGLAALRQRRQGGAHGADRCRLSPTQQEGLRQWTRQGTCFRVAEAQAWVQREYGVRYSYWGMWELLHRLRLRPKRPRPQAAHAAPAAQAAWKGGA